MLEGLGKTVTEQRLERCIGKSRNTKGSWWPQKPGERHGTDSPSERCPHLDFRLPAPRTVSEYRALCARGPRKLIQRRAQGVWRKVMREKRLSHPLWLGCCDPHPGD